MSDWIGLAFIVLLIVGGVVASARLGRPPERISEEEFQKRVREGQRTQAAMFALQKLFHPKAAEAVAVQQDLRHGYYNKKRLPGEGDDEEAETADDERAASAADATGRLSEAGEASEANSQGSRGAEGKDA
jgi:hypothetical protein